MFVSILLSLSVTTVWVGENLCSFVVHLTKYRFWFYIFFISLIFRNYFYRSIAVVKVSNIKLMEPCRICSERAIINQNVWCCSCDIMKSKLIGSNENHIYQSRHSFTGGGEMHHFKISQFAVKRFWKSQKCLHWETHTL